MIGLVTGEAAPEAVKKMSECQTKARNQENLTTFENIKKLPGSQLLSDIQTFF